MFGPFLHFEAFGSVEHVLREIDAHVPVIFEDTAEKFIEQLKDTVNSYATSNHWKIVAVCLSQGLARHDLEELVENHALHQGQIVIDPAITTPEHQIFQNYTEIKSCRERLVMVNEAAGDVLLILYGIDHLDRPRTREMLMKRLRVVDAVLDLLAEEGLESYGKDRLSNRLLSVGRRIILLMKHYLAQLMIGVREEEVEGYVDRNGNVLNTSNSLFLLYSALHMLSKDIHSVGLRMTVNSLLHNLGTIPQDYSGFGLSFEPFQGALDFMRDNSLHNRPTQNLTAGPMNNYTHIENTAEQPTLKPL